MEPSKKDWKIFREKISDWQETYMEKLIAEYTLLMTSDLPASSKFWELEKRLKNHKKKPGVMLNLKKSEMAFQLVHLLNDEVIKAEDLALFSDELRDYITLLEEQF